MGLNESFEFTYSAPEQEEIRRIREKYLPQQERQSKLDRLRELDEGVTRKGTVIALILGVIGTLIFGVGMSLCMVWERYLPGICVGVAGMAMTGGAYPAYVRTTEREKERITPEILRLTEELMQ